MAQTPLNDTGLSEAALRSWKEGNETLLAKLLEGTATAQAFGGGAAAVSIARTCLSNRLQRDAYAGVPVVSVLLEYFKRPSVLTRIATQLRLNCEEVGVACELVVNVDNPHESGGWSRELQGGFVVPAFSSNVHEARGYNRAAKLARGRYLVIWQDDQVPPNSGQWILDMVRVFDAYPHLGILGMNTYRLCKHTEPTNRFFFTSWDVDPRTGVKWSYTQTVDFAPLAIRKSIYESVGGLDEGQSLKGECGIWGDWELCARTWLAGWTVGYMYLDGRGSDGQPGGTHVGASGERCWGRQQHTASSMFHRRYGVDQMNEEWCGRVWLLNMATFSVSDRGRCPYGSHDTKYGNCTALSPEQAAAAQQQLAELTAAAERRLHGRGGGSAAAAAALATTAAGEVGVTADAGAAADAGAGTGAEGSGVLEISPHIVRDAGGGRRRRRLLSRAL